MARYRMAEDENGDTKGVYVNDGTHPELPEGAFIPNVVGNHHWDEYVIWEETNDADAAEDEYDWDGRMTQVRNSLLTQYDWTQLPDVLDQSRLTAGQVASAVAYRQELADVPQNNTNVTTKTAFDAISWPTKPSFL